MLNLVSDAELLTPLRPLFPLWYLALARLVLSRLARAPDGPGTACAASERGLSNDRTRWDAVTWLAELLSNTPSSDNGI